MFRRRTIIIAFVFVAAYLLMGGRLYQLQVAEAEHYRELGRQRTHRLKQVAPARGRILDRRGRVLAEDRACFDLWLRPAVWKKIPGQGRKLCPLFPGLPPEKIVAVRDASPQEKELETHLAALRLEKESPLVARLAELLRSGAETPETARRRVARAVAEALFRREGEAHDPRRCFSDIPFSAGIAIAQAQANPYRRDLWDPVEIRQGFSRVYRMGGLFGHLTGYTSTLSAAEYEKLRGHWDKDGTAVPGSGAINSRNSEHGVFFSVRPGSDEEDIIALREQHKAGKTVKTWGDLNNPMVGRTGVEQWYNQDLRGEHTWKLEELARAPGGWRTFINVGTPAPAKNGRDVFLTVDAEFQKTVRDIAVEELAKLAKEYEHRMTLKRHNLTAFPAAVVVMDIHTGEIHALVSLPEFDPNTVRREYTALAADPAKPLTNRVIAENFPPGSSLKTIVAAGALETGKINARSRFLCEGVEHLGNREFVCMNRAHHGNIDVTDALKVSCNIFFYHAGALMGSHLHDASLAAKLSDYGIGKLTGIDLPGEVPGFIAPRAFTGKNWSLGETYHVSIGQGQVDATPLQIATAYAMLLNGGRKVRPHLRYDPADPELNEPLSLRVIPDYVVETVKKGLWKVVQGGNYPRGTAYKTGHIPGFEYIGKTGSAQGRRRPDTHAWFCAAAPAEKPEIVICCLVPYGNHGGSTCGPIVRRIVENYFHLEDFPDRFGGEPDNSPAGRDGDEEGNLWEDGQDNPGEAGTLG